MRDSDAPLVIVLALMVVGGLAAWYYRDALLPQPEPVAVVAVPELAAPEEEAGPRYPIPEMPTSSMEDRDLVPLPPLDDSDAYFLLEIGTAFGPAIESLLTREFVIDKLVTTVDNLPRSELPEKIRPVGRLGEAFVADTNGGDEIVLGISSYARYDALVAQLYYADIDAVYDIYSRYYPLFQKSYERLGYPDAYFNDRLVEVIDHLLATPKPGEPIVLVRPNVLYEFADPDLEALSSGHKLMLRMGPSNAATVKRMLEKFRGKLLAAS
jgi:hypothetical protein